MWAELAAVYMTEESEDETTGVVRQHHIPWQSESMQACLLSTVQLTCNVVLTHVREIVRSSEPSGEGRGTNFACGSSFHAKLVITRGQNSCHIPQSGNHPSVSKHDVACDYIS